MIVEIKRKLKIRTMSSKKALKSLSLLWMGSLVGSGSTFIIYTVLARKIGPELFGLFSSALATITIFSLLAGFGVSKVWLKLFGKEGWEGIRWIKPSLNFVALTLILISIAIFLLTLLELHDDTTRKLLLILMCYIYGYIAVELVCTKLQLEERYNQLALWQLLPNLSRLLIILALYYVLDISLLVLDVGYIYAIIGSIFALLGMYQLYIMRKGNFALKGHEITQKNIVEIPKIKDVFMEAWPFGLANLFAFIYVQSDIIMVKYISGDTEAGYYNVSFVILSAILIIPTILFGKFLMPKYHRWANYDTDKFYKVYKKSNLIMIVTGSLIMLTVILLSRICVPIIFGFEYIPSVALINILAITLPISFLAYSVGATLVTKEHMKLKVKLMGIIALLNISMNIFLIPKFGAKGAAISTVISNLLLLGLYYKAVNERVFTQRKK